MFPLSNEWNWSFDRKFSWEKYRKMNPAIFVRLGRTRGQLFFNARIVHYWQSEKENIKNLYKTDIFHSNTIL